MDRSGWAQVCDIHLWIPYFFHSQTSWNTFYSSSWHLHCPCGLTLMQSSFSDTTNKRPLPGSLSGLLLPSPQVLPNFIILYHLPLTVFLFKCSHLLEYHILLISLFQLAVPPFFSLLACFPMFNISLISQSPVLELLSFSYDELFPGLCNYLFTDDSQIFISLSPALIFLKL